MKLRRSCRWIVLLVLTSSCGVRPSGVERVVRWAEGLGIGRGEHAYVKLPDPMRGYTADGEVLAAHLKDGRVCVLLKTHMGFKGNFSGWLGCSAPVLPQEIHPDDGFPPTNDMFVALDSESELYRLYVKRRYDGDRVISVYFDLN